MPAITCTTIPLPATSPPSSPTDRQTPRIKSLIVDDNGITAKVLCKILSKEFGYSTTCAVSGKEALVKLSQEVFDVIFMDIDMPELSGIETTMAIHSKGSVVLEANRTIPIIAYTTNPCDSKYFEAGMNGWVGKPANQITVRKELERVCISMSS
ncbi:6165_t:CDS:1 [Paraglomus occultum]|uniref:6165_t:CDS:1 n=1 Tax=Paraglomus occultum TaxID=144539 RepID=A0A9N9FZ53_9GLOM|nr:6165_t:CDS:1 [Paraglomus occultum]